jgi:hypothetical protein
MKAHLIFIVVEGRSECHLTETTTLTLQGDGCTIVHMVGFGLFFLSALWASKCERGSLLLHVYVCIGVPMQAVTAES